MRKNKNIGVYPFSGRTKIRKRSLIIYHDIAYVRGYHFREIEFVLLSQCSKVETVLPCQQGILNNAKILHYNAKIVMHHLL